MKKMLTVFLFLLLGTVPAFAGMQKGQVEITPILGVAIPSGDFEIINDAGIAFGVRAGYIISPNTSVGLTVIHNLMDFNSDFDAAFDFLFPGSTADFSITEISSYFRYMFATESVTSPYVSGSVGLFLNRASASSPILGDDTDTQSEVGFSGSVGLLFKGQGNVGGFLEGQIVNDSFDDLTGSSLVYFSARGGVSFYFGGDAGP